MSGTGIAYTVERYRDVVNEIQPLLARHYEEISTNRGFPLLPDWDTYARLDAQGKLNIVTVRDMARDRQLIGYSIFLVVMHLHYQSMKLAQSDIIFIDKPYRRGRTGLGLIDASEQALRALGVNKVCWHVKQNHDWGAILARRGYFGEEINWSKLI
jgi:GNAT superfamily N-acetyltransferase